MRLKNTSKTLYFSLLSLSLVISSCNNNDDSTSSNLDQLEENETIEGACTDGLALNIYPCNGYDLLLNIPVSTFGAQEVNDSWGWTDPSTGKEYALVCTDRSTAFVDITDTENPIYLGNVPTATTPSPWRDVKVYNNYAYIVADNSQGEDNHGLQVFDLTRLRNVTNPPQVFQPDARLAEVGKAHNIVINESSGYAYAVGGNRANAFAGGPVFISLENPANPTIVGGFGEGEYSHDAQVITYNGPDSDYTGREILIGSNEDEVVIADVTDKTNPLKISTISYSNLGYAHQGWLTDDMRYFILGDEIDEVNIGNNTRTIVFDFTDLDNPQFHFDYFSNNPSTDHNGYVKGNRFFQASYRAGMRVLDISNISNRSFTEVGFFDTFPEDNNPGFNGTWNVYPFFESGKIIISDIEHGLFVVKKSN